jgi:hypothetical protein
MANLILFRSLLARKNSCEGAARNLEQGFIVTFRSEGDRNYYVGQPVPVAARATQVTDLARGLDLPAFVGPLFP